MGDYKEYKKTYFGETKIFECDLLSLDVAKAELVISYRPSKSVTFLGMEFPTGSSSFGYYWENRNYNVYHWKGIGGETLLTYFNISRDTKIDKSSVSWLDLIVDVALKPREAPIVLDEDEIPKDMNPSDLLLIKNTKLELLGNMNRIEEELEKGTSEFLRQSRNN